MLKTTAIKITTVIFCVTMLTLFPKQNSIFAQTPWTKGGNPSTANPPTLGTTQIEPLQLITNNIERMRITPAGNVGIGTLAPQNLLHLHQDFAFNPFPPPGSFVLQPVYTQWTNRTKNNFNKFI